MHELSIAKAIVDVAEEEARRAGASRVATVILDLGVLSGVVEEQLRFCFPIACEGSLAAGASLDVRMVEGVGHCSDCDRDYPMPRFLTPCPRCGAVSHEIRAGDELTVASLVIE